MKYIKKFETALIRGLEIGYYVMCEVDVKFFNDLNVFSKNHIGEIIDIQYNSAMPYIVEFDVNFENYKFLKTYHISIYNGKKTKKLTVAFSPNEIIDYSDDKSDLESKISSKIYNL
jgi:hypothetical protein